MNRIIAIFLLSLAVQAQQAPARPTTPPGAPAGNPELQRSLEETIRGHRGSVALYAKNLKTGETVAIDADKVVKTASVIKLPIMFEAFNQLSQGRLSLSDRIVLKPDDRVEGSGVLQFLQPGLQLTIEDAMTLMIIESDNTATNLMIDVLGIPRVNAFSSGMGLRNTYLYKKVFKPAEGPMPADQKTYGLGKTTAREMGRMLEALESCPFRERAHCTAMIKILRNQQHRTMIPRFLEKADTSETQSGVANKTGSLNAVRNDAGIVYTKTGAIVLSIFTYDNEDQSWTPDNQAEVLVGKLAKMVVDAWAPQGVNTGTPAEGGATPPRAPASKPGEALPPPAARPRPPR